MITGYKMTSLEDGNLQIVLELKDKTDDGRAELMNALSRIIDEFYEEDVKYLTLDEVKAMRKKDK